MPDPTSQTAFVWVAPETVPQPIKTNALWALPNPIRSDGEFVAESLRFVSWLATPRPEMRASVWRSISDELIAAAIITSHRDLHDALVDWFSAHRKGIEHDISAECASVEVLTRALGLPSSAPPRPTQGKPAPKPFEFAGTWSAVDALAEECQWPEIRRSLVAAYGEDPVTPIPGGDSVVSRRGYVAAGPNPWAARGDRDITLTDKLYREARALGVTSVNAVLPIPSPFAPTGNSAAAARLMGQLFTKIAPKGIGPWHDWLVQLDRLDAMFRPLCDPGLGRAAALSDAALAVGIPWALALTSRARQIVCDALRLLFVFALPIHALHDEIDGLLAAALVEARLQAPEYLSKGACRSLVWLSAEQTAAAIARWSSLPVSKAVLESMQQAPVWSYSTNVIKQGKRVQVGHLRDAKESARIALANEQKTWPSFGAVQLAELLKTWEHRFHFGSTSFACLQLASTAWLMREADAANVPFPRTTPSTRATPGGARCAGRIAMIGAPQPVPSSPEGAPVLDIGAGSLFRGGRHPPHKTHTLGDAFDLSLPRETVAWIPFRFKDPIEEAAAASIHKEVGDVWGVCQSKEQRDSKKPIGLVFSKPIKDAVAAQIRRLQAALPPAGEEGSVDVRVSAHRDHADRSIVISRIGAS